ncbi:MAG TPA: patatin-like phospholipase family protein [Burkholderiales bacterium]|nr:patatin-like phospholipase family protein [Burkholderiales bacterium]
MTLAERIHKPGQKKILAMDGGGIRGMISVEILAGIEDMLRRELKAGPDFVLADYFDFVAGTSTGAIIAACIAAGMSMARIRKFYEESGVEMFDRASLLKRLHYKYGDDNLVRKLKSELGAATTLGDPKLRCLLMMVLRNATTDSPWPVSNNPLARYNQGARADCNLNLPLWQLVRASTAAPTFFPPEVVNLGAKSFVFVDGGVTMYNNPAFHAFLMATTQPYQVNWEAGQNNMLLVSIGTGVKPNANDALEPGQMHLGYEVKTIAPALMHAAKTEQDFLCRVFGDCKVGLPLDREIGDMFGQSGPARPKLFTYMRYDADITQAGLDALGLNDIEAASVQALDSIEHIAELQRLGRTVAERLIDPMHYAQFLR